MEKKKVEDASEDNWKKICFPYPFKPWNGKVIGTHQGAHFYTIGQRKGLHIGGHTEPLFVLSTDVHRNIIYVGEGQEHPGLYRRGLFISREQIHWIREDLRLTPGEHRDYLVRVRYRQPLEDATLHMREEGLWIIFRQEQRGITPGQFAAWYDGEELTGSGIIS